MALRVKAGEAAFTGKTVETERRRSRPTESGRRHSRRATARPRASTKEKSFSEEEETVGDVMAMQPLLTVKEDTPVLEALEQMLESGVTGMPVVGKEGDVVGVLSDYDLLALEGWRRGAVVDNADVFPDSDTSWEAFKRLQEAARKANSKTAGDCMSKLVVSVRPSTNLKDAAGILISRGFRRLPVVDEKGRLLGLLTRGSILRTSLFRATGA